MPLSCLEALGQTGVMPWEDRLIFMDNDVT
jgi:hypothetical protein